MYQSCVCLWHKLDLGQTKGDFTLQIEGQTLLVANAGDSRCVVSESGKAVAMSYDHKPTDAAEHSRIIKVCAQNSSEKIQRRESSESKKKTSERARQNHLSSLALLNIDSTKSF